ncbi:MAG: GrpB family protein [Anaerolineales bacterium]|nr:GrpB family protein [Anaerolineales bacterium]
MDSNNTNTPMTEEEILAATVGDRKPHNSTVHLASYDPAWPVMFAQLKQRVAQALGDKILLLEHVGSTSIPGLSAKPIIDMLLVVEDSSDEDAYVASLEQQDFTLRIREPNWHAHRLFKFVDPKTNLHVFSDGCEEIEKMLLFRDWLRTHAEDRLRYEETKRELAARTWKYTQNYADAKSKVVQEIMARARRA